jgi:preprotein translocase subunit SecE
MENFDGMEENSMEREARPSFLTVLCILSFISIGLGILSGLIGLAFGPMSEEAMLQQKTEWAKMADELRSLGSEGFAVMMEQFERMLDALNRNHYANSAISVLIRMVGLLGVFWMWKGKKNGFHLYIIFSLLALVQMYFFVSPADIPTIMVIWNVSISALFVFLYSRNLKWLTA